MEKAGEAGLNPREERILLLAPTGLDSRLLEDVLGKAELGPVACRDMEELVREADRGVGAVVLAEEALMSLQTALLKDMLARQETWSDIPILILTSSGEMTETRLWTLNIFNPSGNVIFLERPLRIIVLMSSIQVALRARRRQYQARDLLSQVKNLLQQRETVLSSIRDGFFTLDLEWRFAYVNDKAAELMRKPKEGLLGSSIWDSRQVSLGPHFRLNASQARETRRHVTFEEHNPETDWWYEYRIYPSHDGLSIFVADITGRKRAEEVLKESEERLRQSQKMEAVGKLAGGIAHDFNNLLTAINGYSDLLLAQDSWDPAMGRPALEEIKKAGERAASLTKQLLAYSRKQVMTLKVLDLNGIVADMVDILGRIIGEDIRLDVRLSPAALPVRADRTQIEQVIMNLAVNARDAMPKGGVLTISTAAEPEQRRGKPGGAGLDYQSLCVEDTGVGMDPQTQSRIFEPFFTTKEQGKGTGLGLSTVYGIVNQLEGHISVRSEPGRGAAFKILFPAHSAVRDGAEPAESAASPAPAGRASGTILVVEDEESLQRFIGHVLRGKGYRILQAGTGEEALKLSAGFHEGIDLLLTDVVMPGMSGRELAGLLTTDRPSLQVLYMSGYTDDELLKHGILDGQTRFLSKPFSSTELVARIHGILESLAAPGSRERSPEGPGPSLFLELPAVPPSVGQRDPARLAGL